MEIEYASIDEITPYLNNAKMHPTEQIEQIKKSIEQYGMNDPIAVSGSANLIVEGHGRYYACKELGMKSVPIIRLDELDDNKRKAYALVHNKLAMETGFDFERLEAELEKIDDDLSFYGLQKNIDALDFDDLSGVLEGGEEPQKSIAGEKKYCTCPFCGERVER